MVKYIIKQIFIILLICIAILLIFALVFYQYIPSNKVIPSKVEAYETPETIKAEIEEKAEGQELIGRNEMYEITDEDLSLYKSTKNYNPGKSDPFSKYDEQPKGNNIDDDDSDKNNSSKPDKNTTDNYYTAENVARGTK